MVFNPEDVPYVPEELVTEEKQGMYIVLAPELPNCVSVNAAGRDIIALCDGVKTVREITEILSLEKGEDPEENLPLVVKFFNYLEGKKFTSREPVNPEEVKPRQPTNLISLWLNITSTCNLRCRHCHSSFGKPLEDELTTEEIIHTIQEVSQFPECTLIISGGEPLCRDDVLEVLRQASKYCGGRVVLITNGTLVTDETAQVLADLHIKVQVSLEGPDEESNDAIRGRGVFQKVIQTIKTLKRAGVEPSVRMTLLKTNIDKVENIIELTRKEGIGRVAVGILQRSGRAYEFIKDIDVTTEELIRVYRKIKDIDPGFNCIGFVENLKPGITRMERRDLCGAGTGILSVGANGGVYPCAGLMYPQFLAGNIKENTLEEIWKESPVLKEIRRLSVSRIPGCTVCPIRYVCGGGCLVDIFWEHNNVVGRTPRCELLYAMKWDELKKTQYHTRKVNECILM